MAAKANQNCTGVLWYPHWKMLMPFTDFQSLQLSMRKINIAMCIHVCKTVSLCVQVGVTGNVTSILILIAIMIANISQPQSHLLVLITSARAKEVFSSVMIEQPSVFEEQLSAKYLLHHL